ncbi:MAG: DnaD domain protein [Oscillospiraceae bacterium]
MNRSEEFRLLVGEVQRTLGRILTTEELKILLSFRNYLDLPAEVVSMLVCYCKERLRRKGSNRNPSLRTIEKEAYAWAEPGHQHPWKRARPICRLQNARYARTANLMKLLQISGRSLTPAEDRYAQAWLDMDFDSQALQMAYEKTCLNTGGLKWPYMNKILQSWHSAEPPHRGADPGQGIKNPLPRPSGSRRVPPPWVRWSGRPLPGCSGSRNRRGNQWHIQERCCAGPGRRLAQAKAEREAENAEHLRRAYRQVPRLAEIDRALRLTMAQAAQTVFQQGGDPQAEFARIRQENQALQREREWLVEDNFEEGSWTMPRLHRLRWKRLRGGGLMRVPPGAVPSGAEKGADPPHRRRPGDL